MKNHLTIHANDRYYERSNQEVTRKEIINHITNGGEINFAKRITASRSLAYVPIKDEVFKVIINRKSKIIISILPFKDNYVQKIKFFSVYYDNKNYMVEMYPDCYLETKNVHALTRIYETYGDFNNELNYNHPFFEGLFKYAWQLYLEWQRTNKNETNTVKAETKAIEIRTAEAS